jgi:hypothetical protein
MNTINMNELTRVLNAKGIPATYQMSGGGCGTIYAGRIDRDGYYECAVGPSVFYTGEAVIGDLCYSKDGEEGEIYYVKEGQTVSEIAEEIESMFFAFGCGLCGGIYTAKDADYAGEHQATKCEGAN